eukprot:TRINITY_DN58449_c0_g1_i1.p1 TRINITY_DN58449_c0_g1~~TRINITY_DN58449_c0_g1_i1.p1  ORF type:complete len:225 (-),score=19.40 TRINITY_DN58449_c0_g1_i1:227-901(-)
MLSTSRRFLVSSFNLYVKDCAKAGLTSFSDVGKKWQNIPEEEKNAYRSRAVLETPKLINGPELFIRAFPGRDWESLDGKEQEEFHSRAAELTRSKNDQPKPSKPPGRLGSFAAFVKKTNSESEVKLSTKELAEQWKLLNPAAKRKYRIIAAELSEDGAPRKYTPTTPYRAFMKEYLTGTTKESMGVRMKDGAARWRKMTEEQKEAYATPEYREFRNKKGVQPAV